MKIVLFVEGPSDGQSISILARRMDNRLGLVCRVLPRGDLLNPLKVQTYIHMDVLQQHPDTKKIILCVDFECTQENESARIVRSRQEQLSKLVTKPPSFYCAVVHATESWLVGDEKGLSRYLNQSKISISAVGSVRTACKPKPAMDRLFRRYQREFSNVRDNPKLAEILDLREVAKNSKSFARFARLVRDP